MIEKCPLGNEEVWDDDIPAACLECWREQFDARQVQVQATPPSEDEIGAKQRVRRGIKRARGIGRRVMTEQMMLVWPDLISSVEHEVRTTTKNIACIAEGLRSS